MINIGRRVKRMEKLFSVRLSLMPYHSRDAVNFEVKRATSINNRVVLEARRSNGNAIRRAGEKIYYGRAVQHKISGVNRRFKGCVGALEQDNDFESSSVDFPQRALQSVDREETVPFGKGEVLVQ